MIARLDKTNTGKPFGHRARVDRIHQTAAERAILHGRINRDGTNSGDRVSFVEKIAPDHTSVHFGDDRVKLRMSEHPCHEPDRNFRRGEIARKSMRLGNSRERLVANPAARLRVRGRSGPQLYVHQRMLHS